MELLLDPRLLLSGCLVLVTIGLLLIGRRLQQPVVATTIVTGIGLLVALWVPQVWRDALLSLSLVGLIFVGGGGLVAGLIGAAICYGVALVVPGGALSVLLVVLAVVGVVLVRSAVVSLRRMARVRTLEPGEPPLAKVQIGGRLRARALVPVPGKDFEAAAWQVESGTEKRWGGEELELITDAGTVLVEPKGAELDLKREEMFTEDKDARKTAVAAELELQEGFSVTLHWLPDDVDAHVVGVPIWEVDRAGSGSYREAPMVPVFRATEQHPVYLADRSELDLRREAHWRIWSWSAWGLSCVVVCLALAFG